MKTFNLFLAALVVFVQLPALSFAAAAPEGPAAVSPDVLHSVTGGVCTNCPPSNDTGAGGGGGGGGRAPTEKGSPYWELTSTRLTSQTNPGGTLVYQTQNRSNSKVAIQFTFTRRESYNWSGGAGIPGNVLTASLGKTYDNTSQVRLNTSLPAQSRLKFYTSHPTSRYSHSFTQYQDWSDGSRQALRSGSASSSQLSTNESLVVNPL